MRLEIAFNYVKGIIVENAYSYIVPIDKISFNGLRTSYLLIRALLLKFSIVEQFLSSKHGCKEKV